MPVMGDDYDYDEYQVYVSLPTDRLEANSGLLTDVIHAGMVALGIEPDTTMEINWVDSLSN